MTPFSHYRVDGGPIYVETDLDRWIAEPLNAATAFVFVAIAWFWWLRIRRQPSQYLFLRSALGLLAVGGVGGTLFHGLRVSKLFLLLDVLPIGILGLASSLYFWRAVLPKRWHLLAVVIGFVAVQAVLVAGLPRTARINASYISVALLILAPLWLHLKRRRFENARLVLAALAAFLVAITFRALDPYSSGWVPHGTHWLWHLGSAASVFWLIEYIYRTSAPAMK